jgi:3-oxoacyl-[acyl-carrier protein] reductase
MAKEVLGMDLENKVIVITGAARGLGRKMAEVIARERAQLALVDLDEAELQETASLCASAGSKAKSYPVNVTQEAAVEGLFAAVCNDFGSVDGLINNAGANRDALLVKVGDSKVIGKMSLADFNTVISVDLVGVFLCGREAAVHMIDGGRGGVIINISSISSAGNIGQTNYSAAKAGVAAMTVTWAKELARYNIRVTGIAPGFCDTRMVANIPSKIRDKIISTIPLRRLGEPEEIARAALFIFQNDFYDGRVLEIDGGLRL